MKNLIASFMLIFLYSMIGFSQPTMTKADELREEGDLMGALEAYKKQYDADPTDRDNTYNYACALAISRQVDTAFHYLSIAIENDSSVHALNDPDLYFLSIDDRWKTIEDDLIQRVEAKHGKYENLALSKELWRMKIKDQAFYYNLQAAEKVCGRGSPAMAPIWELKSMINEQNITRIEEIIEEYGWPKKSIVKGAAASTVFLIIQHADIDVQKKYLPVMTEAANNGEANWSSLALLIDRVNLREGKSQIYGSQVYRNDDGTFYVKDLLHPEYVNQRRAEVGLGPIEDYVERWGVEWDVEQKTK